ncbi:hypothetical protein IJI31_01115 [bacterium]|nr:hypothetical protein [bacterium]
MKHSELLQLITKQIGKEPSQQELAKILGLTRNGISSRAHRDKEYSYSEVEKIKQFYGVSFDKESYINDLLGTYSEIPEHTKKILLSYYNQGIDLNWLITGKGNKYRAQEFEQVKDELAQRMDKLEAALKSAGILAD